jgi:hypothetical protein
MKCRLSTTGKAASALQMPFEIVTKWQEIVALLAGISDVPAALVMKLDPPQHQGLANCRSVSTM